jgi:peptidoglycan/LPS O-acetylase OafA/YrhL
MGLLQLLKRPRRIDDRGFSTALLSLRGFAALFVTIFHAMLVFRVAGHSPDYWSVSIGADSPWDLIANSFVIYLTNSHAAVTFFFVHSGFVLALSMSHRMLDARPVAALAAAAAYLVRRVFRLWPMIIVGCVCAFLVQSYFNLKHDDPYYSDWFTRFFATPTDLSNLLENIVLLRYNLVPFLWSLNVEAWGSLLIPLIFLACRRYVTVLVLLAALYFGLPILTSLLPHGLAQWTTFHTMACFVIGCLVGFIGADLPAKPSWIKRDALTLCAFFILILVRWIMPNAAWPYLVESAASAVIIYNVYYHPNDLVPRFCNRPFAKLLGEISYSLYVNSWVCIFLVGLVLAALVPAGFIVKNGLLMNLLAVAAVLVVAVPMSWMTFTLLERPMMTLGRRLGAKLLASNKARPVARTLARS